MRCALLAERLAPLEGGEVCVKHGNTPDSARAATQCKGTVIPTYLQ
jgi:hypothetical protein